MIYRLYEDIYGNKATVYHRTSIQDLISKVWDTGFKPGMGDFYGKGFYSTYDLKSQQKENMASSYGKMIVKFYVSSLYNFFGFEYSEFLKLPISKRLKDCDEQNFINKQLKSIGIKDEFDATQYTYSSYILKIIYDKYGSKFTNKVDGVIYNGESDGKCLLAYNTDIIVPFTYSIDDGKSFVKVNEDTEKYLKSLSKSHEANATNFYGTKERRDILQIIKDNDINAIKKYLKNFIRNKGDINAKLDGDGTALMIASIYGLDDVVKVLLQYKANPDIPNGRNETPLYASCVNGYVAVMKLLLNAGANPNIPNNKNETPLMKACENGDTDIVHLLLEYNADVNKKSIYDETALNRACFNSYSDIVDLLLQYKANPDSINAKGETALYQAVTVGSIIILRSLLKADANPNIGKPPLHNAVVNKYIAEADMLLEYGANVNIMYEGKTLLYHAITEDMEMVKLLLEYDINVNFVDNKGLTALMLASTREEIEIVKMLLKAGANVNYEDEKGYTVLYVQCMKEPKFTDIGMIKLFLAYGADADTKTEEGSALWQACYNNNSEVVKLLLNAGANPNMKTDEEHYTPLWLMVINGNEEMIEALLKAGANPNVKDPNGRETLLSHVNDNEALKGIAELLKQYGATK